MLFGSTQHLKICPLEGVPVGTTSIMPSKNVSAGLQHGDDSSCQRNLILLTSRPALCRTLWSESGSGWCRKVTRCQYPAKTSRRPWPSLPLSEHHSRLRDVFTGYWQCVTLQHQPEPDSDHRVRHSAAHVVTEADGHENIKPVLQQLRWLSVEQSIKYKFLLKVYHCLNDLAPAYISELLRACIPSESCGQTPRAFWWGYGRVQDRVTVAWHGCSPPL